jgi:hypothetical protein
MDMELKRSHKNNTTLDLTIFDLRTKAAALQKEGARLQQAHATALETIK